MNNVLIELKVGKKGLTPRAYSMNPTKKITLRSKETKDIGTCTYENEMDNLHATTEMNYIIPDKSATSCSQTYRTVKLKGKNSNKENRVVCFPKIRIRQATPRAPNRQILIPTTNNI